MQNFHIFLLKFLFISFFKTFPYKNLPQWRDPQLGGPAWQFCQEYHLSDWTVLHSREDRRAGAGVHWWWQESASYCILCTWDSSCGRGFCQQPCIALWQTQISRKIFLRIDLSEKLPCKKDTVEQEEVLTKAWLKLVVYLLRCVTCSNWLFQIIT